MKHVFKDMNVCIRSAHHKVHSKKASGTRLFSIVGAMYAVGSRLLCAREPDMGIKSMNTRSIINAISIGTDCAHFTLPSSNIT